MTRCGVAIDGSKIIDDQNETFIRFRMFDMFRVQRFKNAPTLVHESLGRKRGPTFCRSPRRFEYGAVVVVGAERHQCDSSHHLSAQQVRTRFDHRLGQCVAALAISDARASLLYRFTEGFDPTGHDRVRAAKMYGAVNTISRNQIVAT